MSGAIAHEEVLGHVYRFLHENGYYYALLALQSESRVAYNVIVEGETSFRPPAPNQQRGKPPATSLSKADLRESVLAGKWDRVLKDYVDRLTLPQEQLYDIYEQVFEEILHIHHLEHAARAFLTNSPVFRTMRQSAGPRYVRLSTELEKFQSVFGAAAEGHSSRLTQQRHVLADMLVGAITWEKRSSSEDESDEKSATSSPSVGEGSLPALIYTALQHGRNRKRPRVSDALEEGQGSGTGESVSADTNRNSVLVHSETSSGVVGATRQSDRDRFLVLPLTAPNAIARKAVYEADKMATACAMVSLATENSREPQIVVGRADGVAEFVDGITGSVLGVTAAHSTSVLSISVDEVYNKPPTWVALGYRDGWVKVYNADTRKLVRRFGQVHTQGVTSITFAGDRMDALGGHKEIIVTGSYDGSIAVLGLIPGSVLQRFAEVHHGHYINALAFVPPPATGDGVPGRMNCLVSVGNDGTLNVWEDVGGGQGIRLVQEHMPLSAVHQKLRDETVSQLEPVLNAPNSEMLLVTRNKHALVLRVECVRNAGLPTQIHSEPTAFAKNDPKVSVTWKVQHVMSTHGKPFRGGCARCFPSSAYASSSLSANAEHVPVAVLLTDENGSILLYNYELRSASDGATMSSHSTDESGIVVGDVGSPVDGLCIQFNWENDNKHVLTYSPQCLSMYLLTW